MIPAEQLQILSEKLKVYDVDQEGWEQEPHGFEVNVTHVLTHLVRDMIDKDFTDPKVIKGAVVPDAVQYALRLGRWTNQGVEALLPTKAQMDTVLELASRNFGGMSLPQTALHEAQATLARNLHDLHHSSTREESINRRPLVARAAAGCLLYGASQFAYEHRFNIVEVFDLRLAHLRKRFNIPEPAAPSN